MRATRLVSLLLLLQTRGQLTAAELARVLAISTVVAPEVVLYPELGKFGVATRDPFAPLPEGAHPGIVGLFDLPPET